MLRKIFYLLLLCNYLVSSSIAMTNKHFNQCASNISKQYKKELQDKQQVNTNNINKNIDKFETINKNYKQEIDNNNKFKIIYSSFKQQIDKNNTQNNNKDKTNSKQIEKFKLTKEYFDEQTRIIGNDKALTPDNLNRNGSFLEYQKDEIFQKAEISNKLDDTPLAEQKLFSNENILLRRCNTSYNNSLNEDLVHIIILKDDNDKYPINTTCPHDNTTQYKSIISDKSNKN